MHLRTALAREMETCFGQDARRVGHAHRVTGYAEKLLEGEDADATVVLAAAMLHDIGIHEAERKHGSTAGRFQEMEGPPIARRILDTLGLDAPAVDEVCDIIAHHHSPGRVTTTNFAVLYDADWLVNLADEYDTRDRARLHAIIGRVFLTPTGRALAGREYLPADDALSPWRGTFGREPGSHFRRDASRDDSSTCAERGPVVECTVPPAADGPFGEFPSSSIGRACGC